MVDNKPQNQTLWHDFMKFCDNQTSSQWIYRGVPDSKFRLIPKVGRPPAKYSAGREKNIFELFEKRAQLFENFDGLSKFDKLVVAQHHGLPTRMLDWTTSPLIAAYFAVVQQMDTEAKDAKIYSFRTKGSDYLSKDDGDPFAAEDVKFYLPRFVSPRIAAQSGLFSIHPRANESWDSEKLIAFIIPSSAKDHFRRRLHFLGINALKLFPGLDGLAETLDWQYRSNIELWHVS